MTDTQRQNEKNSVEAFVENETKAARERGADAATTYVILTAVRAAAAMAPRREDGSIDEDIARLVLSRAACRLARTP